MRATDCADSVGQDCEASLLLVLPDIGDVSRTELKSIDVARSNSLLPFISIDLLFDCLLRCYKHWSKNCLWVGCPTKIMQSIDSFHEINTCSSLHALLFDILPNLLGEKEM
jgi:hypothetical protein